jgi:hypothetical protein
MTANHSCVYSF